MVAGSAASRICFGVLKYGFHDLAYWTEDHLDKYWLLNISKIKIFFFKSKNTFFKNLKIYSTVGQYCKRNKVAETFRQVQYLLNGKTNFVEPVTKVPEKDLHLSVGFLNWCRSSSSSSLSVTMISVRQKVCLVAAIKLEAILPVLQRSLHNADRPTAFRPSEINHQFRKKNKKTKKQKKEKFISNRKFNWKIFRNDSATQIPVH